MVPRFPPRPELKEAPALFPPLLVGEGSGLKSSSPLTVGLEEVTYLYFACASVLEKEDVCAPNLIPFEFAGDKRSDIELILLKAEEAGIFYLLFVFIFT